MFKRVVWFGTGFTAGMAGGWWVKRQVQVRVERYVPDRIRDEARVRARTAAREVQAAVAEGRAVMREYEADARADLEAAPRRRRMRPV